MKFYTFIIVISLVFCEAVLLTKYAVPRKCSTTYSVTEPRYVPYEETYATKNWLGYTKYKTRINYRLEYNLVHKKKDICCDGYSDSGSTLCIPNCKKSCGVYGVCSKPDTCTCNEGYLMDPFLNECKPICMNECVMGYCSSPNVCTCNDGYYMTNDNFTCEPICDSCSDHEICVEPHVCRCISGYERYPLDRLDSQSITEECQPFCSQKCINAECIKPFTCKCYEGYEDIDGDAFNCEPICKFGCRNGKCVAPDTCECNSGYKLKKNSTSICEPVCTEKCINSDCIAPEICSCHDGYISLSSEWNHICEPYCSKDCLHGRCIAPEICSCDLGYQLVNNGSKCEPICTEPCFMGNCTAPDTCTCLEGYQLAKESNYTCEPICNNECINGRCTAPGECTCNDGYEKKNTTDDDSVCIVICECEYGYCNETSSMCETCAEGYELGFTDNSTICKPHCESGCKNGLCVEPETCECNENYVSDNDTRGNSICVHACGAECEHGTCIQETGICNCPYGWSGKYCNELLSCAIIVLENDTLYLQLNESYSYEDNENITIIEDPWTGPNCSNRCLKEINKDTKCFQSDGEQLKFVCFLNIDSQCHTYSVTQNFNSNNKAETNMNMLIVLIVMALLIVVIAIVTALFIKKRKSEKSIELMKSVRQIQKREGDLLIDTENENENEAVEL